MASSERPSAVAGEGALAGLRVLDFSTRVPGPLASLILADAGADVIKVERPDGGDEGRGQAPTLAGDGAGFALLNRGKRSVALDLKAPEAPGRLAPLIASADVLIEQFRPGVMERLGLGYEQVKLLNPRLVYCAIRGFGYVAPFADAPGHDLNYVAESGMLGLTADPGGAPVIPASLVADVAGGSYPAVMNILLALRQRDRTGEGCKVELAMSDNLYPMMHWALAQGWAAGAWPRAGSERLTGGSPRYQIYRTADDRFIACTPLEDKFWASFCEAIELRDEYRPSESDMEATKREVASIIALRRADYWMARFAERALPCSIVRVPEESLRARIASGDTRLHDRVGRDGGEICALPLPIAEVLRVASGTKPWPRLGEHNDLIPGEGNAQRSLQDGS